MRIHIDIPPRALKQVELIRKMGNAASFVNASTVSISGIYTETKRVQDAYRYVITVRSGIARILCSFEGGRGRFNDKVPGSANPTIVLVIESPYKDEYDDQFLPIAPAQGATGIWIEKRIAAALSQYCGRHLSDGCYDLIICNPVQFQAAMYELHRTELNGSLASAARALRDKAWRAIYTDEKGNFRQRICSYNPAIIVIACTSQLRSDIEDDLTTWREEGLITAAIYRSNKHPCCWRKLPVFQDVANMEV